MFAGPGTSLSDAFFHLLLLKSARRRPAAFTTFSWDTALCDLKLFLFLWYFLLADRSFANSNDRVFVVVVSMFKILNKHT